MSILSHEERIISRCRDVYSGRNVPPEFAAKTCGISLAEFEDFYSQYINRLCYAIQHKHELFLFSELRFLVLSGYMRPDECAKRFLGNDSPENIAKIERWIESQGGINKDLSWRNVRFLQVEQKEQETQNGRN